VALARAGGARRLRNRRPQLRQGDEGIVARNEGPRWRPRNALESRSWCGCSRKTPSWKCGKQDASGRYALLKTIRSPLSGELGRRSKEGDRQAPEGFYTHHPGADDPNSAYYLSFTWVPNAYDKAWAAAAREFDGARRLLVARLLCDTDDQIGESMHWRASPSSADSAPCQVRLCRSA